MAKTRTRAQKVDRYEEAKKVYDDIQQKKRDEKIKRQEEIKKKAESMQKYNQSKKKMQKALMKRNKKGQPNLGAQIEVMLEKMQKKVGEGK
ncbi:unnamed protein product [Caenorhabditis auriculariae]|uniref:Uncharacterized protein n=1 Tax=Caenorhabditis auriculariae TaxID=2777116 RepID=A0A8S1H0B6_9PELO|nr:unnamed protein product [Caenorhabditis auriculariae]